MTSCADFRLRRGARTVAEAAAEGNLGDRANTLRALLKAEQGRGPDFLRLANALSALYPEARS